MITDAQREQHRRDLVEHNDAITRELAKYPEPVGRFLRTNFHLHMYPLSFTEKMAAAAMTFADEMKNRA